MRRGGLRKSQIFLSTRSLNAGIYLFRNKFACEQITTHILGPILLQRTGRLITFVWGLWF